MSDIIKNKIQNKNSTLILIEKIENFVIGNKEFNYYNLFKNT